MKKNGLELLAENGEKMEEFWNKAKLEERAKN